MPLPLEAKGVFQNVTYELGNFHQNHRLLHCHYKYKSYIKVDFIYLFIPSDLVLPF